jgi:hypothetical protein
MRLMNGSGKQRRNTGLSDVLPMEPGSERRPVRTAGHLGNFAIAWLN